VFQSKLVAWDIELSSMKERELEREEIARKKTEEHSLVKKEEEPAYSGNCKTAIIGFMSQLQEELAEDNKIDPINSTIDLSNIETTEQKKQRWKKMAEDRIKEKGIVIIKNNKAEFNDFNFK
jgi:hypothetical protein